MIKIRSIETNKHYEEWIYWVDALPQDFDDMTPEDKYDWFSYNAKDAMRLSSDPAEYEGGTVDEYEIVTEEA